MFSYESDGYCPVCDRSTTFVAVNETEVDQRWWPNWFRGHLQCRQCGSIPRERALFQVLSLVKPDWRTAIVHESSPGMRETTLRMRNECVRYVESQYDQQLPRGAVHPTHGYRCENLEDQTFENETFDIVVTQDVFEHLFAPDRAISEIARTLKDAGMCIMTVPIVRKDAPSMRRAIVRNGAIEHLLPPQYHGNPLRETGSLVTIDWGYDIVHYLSVHSGLAAAIYSIDDMSKGIRAEYNEVIVCRKATSIPEL